MFFQLKHLLITTIRCWQFFFNWYYGYQ